MYSLYFFISDASNINCAIPDEDKTCHIPFTLRGKTYSSCIPIKEFSWGYSTSRKLMCLTIADDADSALHDTYWCYCDVQSKLLYSKLVY